ncbi:MAG: sigma-70 family RNA polymerase sigma factor [Abditibacteriaceae bacterium]
MVTSYMVQTTDEGLAAKAALGDADSFERIVTRYQQRVYRLCYRYAGNADDAEDWAQESLVRIYRNLHYYNAELPFAPWAMRVAANTCINQSKKRLRHDQHLKIDEDELEEYSTHDAGPLQSAINAEEKQAVLNAIATLPPLMKQALTLRMSHEMPFHEIAETLDIPLQTAATRVRRALDKLRKILTKDEKLAAQMANLEQEGEYR